ncbi:hypothetical protein Tco_0689827 [Tanacetum coccineum]
MANLKFADTYNMVEFLSKPAESKGFKQIVDFLNAHIIKYALTVNPTIYTLCIEQFWATVKAKTINGEVQLQALVDGKKIIITESIVRRDLQLEDDDGVNCLPNATIFEQLTLMGSRRSKRKDTEVPQPSGPITNVANKAVNEEMDYSLGRAATIATGLDAEQDRGNIDMTQSKATLNESSSLGTSSGNGTRRQETMGIQLLRLGLRMYLNIPMIHCSVLALETIKTAQANEIASLKKRVKKLNRRNKLRTYGLKYKELLWIILILMLIQFLFRVHDLDGNEVIVNNEDVVTTAEETRSVVEEVTVVIIPVSVATTTTTITAITDVEMTLAQALAELNSAKPKADKEQVPTPTVSSQQPSHVNVQDKGKGKMVEPEPVKKMSKKDLLRLDEELAFKLQAEEEEEERLAREKAK